MLSLSYARASAAKPIWSSFSGTGASGALTVVGGSCNCCAAAWGAIPSHERATLAARAFLKRKGKGEICKGGGLFGGALFPPIALLCARRNLSPPVFRSAEHTSELQ